MSDARIYTHGIVLFIGGCADGLRMDDPKQPYWIVADTEAMESISYAINKPVSHELVQERYRRELLRSGGEEWVIYVRDSISTTAMMSKLFNGYVGRKQSSSNTLKNRI